MIGVNAVCRVFCDTGKNWIPKCLPIVDSLYQMFSWKRFHAAHFGQICPIRIDSTFTCLKHTVTVVFLARHQCENGKTHGNTFGRHDLSFWVWQAACTLHSSLCFHFGWKSAAVHYLYHIHKNRKSCILHVTCIFQIRWNVQRVLPRIIQHIPRTWFDDNGWVEVLSSLMSRA